METNFLNYFITKLSGDLRQEWQLTFETDTSGMDGATHHRTYFADETGVVLASNNDTLMKYAITATVLHQPSLSAPVSGSGLLRAFYLNGRSISSDEGVHHPPHASGILIPAHGVSMKRKTILSIEK